MSRAVRIHELGGPDVLRLESVPTPRPGPQEVLVEQKAIGLNYIDVYFRSGLYKLPKLPAIIGMEGAGVVQEVGSEVDTIAQGDRVAYPSALGAYATHRVVPADRLVRLPDTIAFDTAAAIMLKGLTAHYLLRRTYPVAAGQTLLVHAAAGGVGLILSQWAKHLGARVIGVVSTEAKAERARANGVDHVLIGTEDLVGSVRRITDGAMVPVVFDGIGRDTFEASLDCLAPRGLMVSYGNASGEVTGLALSTLSAKGSLYVTRPTLATYIAARNDLVSASEELFAAIEAGAVKVSIDQTHPLENVAEAHRLLESRRTTGSTILRP